ncbi:glycosyltransferase [Candidatus Poribacteria bacterium]|nr:glycosyltransferase [Candidatus Poribacteria bacterium]
MSKKLCSIVMPVYNEELNLHKFFERLTEAIKDINCEFEFVFVDDGSKDNSFNIISEFSRKDPRVKGLKFSRNFGSHVAITAGLDHVQGDAAVIMAVDLQDPPEVISKFIQEWENGNQIIWGVRAGRKDPILKKITSALFYRILRKIALPNYPKQGTGSFCLLDKKIIEVFCNFKERHRVTFGIVSWSGFKQIEVPYVREERYAGKSKWSFRKLLKSSIDTFASFSYFPIRVISYFGITVSFFSFLFAIYVILRKIIHGARVSGWPSLMVSIMFLGGVQLITLGVIGEYVWRIFEEVKKRPLYIMDEKIGFANEESGNLKQE